MRWLLLVCVTACGFSTRIPGAPDDGGPGDGPDAVDPTGDGPLQPGCRVVEIEAMSAQTCVRRSDGQVFCWGRNADDAIGVVSTTTCAGGDDCVRVPAKLTLPEAIVELGLGDRHSCALSATKTYCWGRNANGQFGDNSTNNATTPREIPLRSGASAIRGGSEHTCSLHAGVVLCSGRNQFGEVGDASTTQRETPTAAGVAGTSTAIGAGFEHTCAVNLGNVFCWGRNASASVDTSGNTPITSPRMVANVANATAVVGGVAHTCARIMDGSVRCWGANNLGQLGVGNTAVQTGPQTVTISGVSQIAAGVNHTCVLAGTGVWCWGEDYGPGPVQVNFAGAPPTTASAVAAGSYHDCALMTDGTVRCWGNNMYGQLGNNSTTSSTTPVQPVVCP